MRVAGRARGHSAPAAPDGSTTAEADVRWASASSVAARSAHACPAARRDDSRRPALPRSRCDFRPVPATWRPEASPAVRRETSLTGSRIAPRCRRLHRDNRVRNGCVQALIASALVAGRHETQQLYWHVAAPARGASDDTGRSGEAPRSRGTTNVLNAVLSSARRERLLLMRAVPGPDAAERA